MELRVGIVGQESGWMDLLRREGVPFAQASTLFRPDDWAVLIVGDSAERSQFPGIRTYLNDGGAVIASSLHAGALIGRSNKRRRVRTVLPSRDSDFPGLGLLDLFTPLAVPSGANTVPDLDNTPAVFSGRQGHGHVIILPFDVPALLMDGRAMTKSFPSPAARLPFERVSAVAKGEVRMLAARCIEVLHHRRGLPFVHIWYYPDAAPSVFAFRVDTDYADERTVGSLYDLARTERIPMTWFVHVERQRSFLRTFAGMKGQEIGVHCFHHRTSGDANRIAADIRSAVETLGAVGLSPVGYAAPYGRWSPALAEAVAAARFSYSSEFGFAYDDLPLECRAGTGRLLQVPVHPVCLGSLRRHSYSEDQSFAYFESVFRRAVTRRMPAFFYHHPNDGHPEVLRRLFALAREARLPMMTMQRFAGWWQDRSAWRVTARLERDAVTIAAGTDVPARRIRMTTPDGREQFAAGSGSYPLAGPGWLGVLQAAPLPPDAVRARRFNPRIPLVKGLDALVGLFKRKD